MIKVFLTQFTNGFTQALVPISVFTELRTGGEQAALTGAQGTPSPMDLQAEGTRKTAGLGDGAEGAICEQQWGLPRTGCPLTEQSCRERALRGREASRGAAAPARGQRLHGGQREAPGGQSGQRYL